MSSKKHSNRRRRVTTGLVRTGEWLFGARRKIATVGGAVLAVMLGFHVIFGQNGITAFRNKRHDLRDLQNEAKQLQRENGSLQGHVDRLTNDPNAIEHQAREDLHYTRPGEVIVTLSPEARPAQK